jgi:hypothetical protein
MRRPIRRCKIEGDTTVDPDNKTSDSSEDSQGTLWLGKQICVPNRKDINELILTEAYDSAYTIHPDSTKMYKDLKTRYWSDGMK